MINCKTCNKKFHPYLGRRIYCSDECYLEQKHLDNITRWKKDRSNRIDAGKLCRRCKNRFEANFSNSQYCDTCRELLNVKPKKEKLMSSEKVCKDCSKPVPNKDIRVEYCEECREARRKVNIKKCTRVASERAKQVKLDNKKRGKSKPLDKKWLVRGLITSGSKYCPISQEA